MINEYMHTPAKFLQLMCGFNANTNQNLTGVAILILDKIDFKSRRYKRQMKTLYINKRFSTSIRYYHYKYLCI